MKETHHHSSYIRTITHIRHYARTGMEGNLAPNSTKSFSSLLSVIELREDVIAERKIELVRLGLWVISFLFLVADGIN